MRLRRSTVYQGGISRKRRGKGFVYYDESGNRVTEAEVLQRIDELVIPPAWRKVWICPYTNGHIQAVGVDAAGRRQYLYHHQWRLERDEEKHDRVLSMAQKLPQWRDEVATDLSRPRLDKKRVLAAGLRMLDRGIFRTGGEEYAEENGTYGVATLLRKHVHVNGIECAFDYTAKGSIKRSIAFDDKELARTLRGLLRSAAPNERLLSYRTQQEWHTIHADDINERFKQLAGDGSTAKDLRTWSATVLAAEAFALVDLPNSESGRKKIEAAVMRKVAEELGNTPAVCRKSYVDPRIIDAYHHGQTVVSALRRARHKSDDEKQRIIERAVIRLLKKQ